MATIDIIKEILSENLGIDASNVDETSTFESLDIDSLDMVQLICDLEDRLGIDFGEPEGLENLGDVVKHIASLS